MSDELIEIRCPTGRAPLFVKDGPGPVEIRDLNGGIILTLDIKPEGREGRYAYVVGLGPGVRVERAR